MIGIILAIVLIGGAIAFSVLVIKFFIYWFFFSEKKTDTYHPYDEIQNNEMKTYKEWYSLYYDKKELSMTKEDWLKNSNEQLMTKEEFEKELDYEYMVTRD